MPQHTMPAQPTSHVLLKLIVSILAPMFFGVTGFNVALAEAAALETVNDYRARTNADLIAIGQIITHGFAAMASGALSLEQGVPNRTALQLRQSANASSRYAEANRRAIRTHHTAPLPRRPVDVPDPEVFAAEPPAEPETSGLMSPEAERMLADEAEARLREPAPRMPTTDGQVATAGAQAERISRERSALAMIQEARKISTSLHNLSLADQQIARAQAASLTGTAKSLLGGAPVGSLNAALQKSGATDAGRDYRPSAS